MVAVIEFLRSWSLPASRFVESNDEDIGGMRGLVALCIIAFTILLPLTLIRMIYSFTVAYGLSVSAISAWCLALLLLENSVNSETILAANLMLGIVFYGLRLGSFLFWRQQTTTYARDRFKDVDAKSSAIVRIGMSTIFALFYTLMTCPLLYLLRNPSPSSISPIFVLMRQLGTLLCWCGALAEAIADWHKYMVLSGKHMEEFGGPTTGLFALCRHPNYMGSILCFVGMHVASIPSYPTSSFVPWIASGLGLYGYINLMLAASKRLEKRQQEHYGGTQSYEEWKRQVPSELFPFLGGMSTAQLRTWSIFR